MHYNQDACIKMVLNKRKPYSNKVSIYQEQGEAKVFSFIPATTRVLIGGSAKEETIASSRLLANLKSRKVSLK